MSKYTTGYSLPVSQTSSFSASLKDKNLILAVPKKGRLYERCVFLLQSIGLDFNREARSDIATCRAAPVTLVFLNVCDIPVFVAQGDIDAGIAGQDVIAEKQCHVQEEIALGFGKCNLTLQAPNNKEWKPSDFVGKRVVTSFPSLTRAYFAELEPTGASKRTEILSISGSVEASIALGLSDCVVDLVETGDTMRAAGLKEVGVLMSTEAVFLSNPYSRHREMLGILKKRMLGNLTAQRYRMLSYNVNHDHLQDAVKLTPGLRSPNITNLIENNWYSVTAVVPTGEVLSIMDRLCDIGAQDLLTFEFKHCLFDHFNSVTSSTASLCEDFKEERIL